MTTGVPKRLPPVLTSPDGEVLTVYHSGRHDIESFQPLSHFGTLNAAFERLLLKDVLPAVATEDTYLNGTVFYPVQLRIKNPLIVDDDYSWGSNGVTASTMKHLTPAEQSYALQVYDKNIPDKKITEELQQGGLYEINQDSEQNRYNLKSQRVIAILEAKGYDGIAYINREEDSGSVSWVNFRPQQVESAYAGAMTDKPCLRLPGKPWDWQQGLKTIFGGAAKPQDPTLPALQNARWVTPPAQAKNIVDHFADMQLQAGAEQELKEQQFKSEITIAGYDPEHVATRVANGDTSIASFYEACQKRMMDLASKPVAEVPGWQRAYLPEVRRIAGYIEERRQSPVPHAPSA